MVTITNGVKTFRVTAGAITPYKNMGFHVVTDEELEEMKQSGYEYYNDSGIPADSDNGESNGEKDIKYDRNRDGTRIGDKAYIEELLEKPLSQWTNEEVKEFVRIEGIDTSGAQKVSQVRGIIKSYLDERNKNS